MELQVINTNLDYSLHEIKLLNIYLIGFGSSGSSNFGGNLNSASTGGVHQGQSQVLDFSGSSNGGNRAYKTVIKQGEPIITKHFYVHAAPEEEEQAVQVKEQIVRPQKHYKIIFIKAPSSGVSQAAQQAAAFPQVINSQNVIQIESKTN